MTSAEHEIDRFFSRSPHAHTVGVIPRIKADILDLMQTLRLSIRSATWGDTNQLKLCVYGGIPIGSRADYLIPIQIWMTSQYPVDPPTVYVVPSSEDQRVVSNSKVVDGTGLCYCPNLSQWKPGASSLRAVVVQIAKAFQSTPALWTDARTAEGTSSAGGGVDGNAAGGGGGATSSGGGDGSGDDDCVVCLCVAKDTVLVPCGHFCVCSSCAANLPNCPMCRTVIQFRQKVFL